MPSRRSFLLSATAMAATPGFAAEPRLHIGQIGAEHAHAAGKMEAMRSLKSLYEVVGIASASEPKDKVYQELPRMSEDELLALPDLKAVTVETRVEDSCKTALKAIRAGKHVHLDKPGALDHEEFKIMRLEAAQRGLVVQMGYMLRYNPAVVAVVEAMQKGWLGEILEIDAMMGKLADASTRQKIGALAGGGMFELGCHLIDTVITLLGKPAAVHAFSTPTNPADGVQDNQLAVLEYPKATATIRCDHADQAGGPRRRLMVAGTKGCFEIRPLESGEFTAWFASETGPYKKGEQQVKLPVPKGRYDAEFADLAKVIRGSKQLAWNEVHDIAVHETALRAAGVMK